MIIIYNKTYGIIKGYYKGNETYFITLDGKKIQLHYKNPIFAMKKAENFAKTLHKNFIDFKNNEVRFTFQKIDFKI